MNTDSLRRTGRFFRGDLCRLLVFVFAALIALLLFCASNLRPSGAATSTGQQEAKLKDPQFIAEGSKLFGPTCGNAYCHGTGGAGGGAPRLRGKGLESSYLFKSISNGIPGTAMPSFKTELSEEQVWKLIAFIMADADASVVARPEATAVDNRSTQITVRQAPAASAGAGSMMGNVQEGKALFFDSARPKSCHYCHSMEGQGTSIGPDLSKIGDRPARQLFSSIILPHQIKDPRYATVTLRLRNGESVTGVKKEEDDESIRVFDTTELPAVLRTVQKVDVIKSEAASESIMPKDYASTYTVKQLLDLVTFLKSSESKAPVMLRDLLD
jgi:putative heme-binding domain-containing protein